MSCKHEWVIYQPLFGEPYECCSLAGCGITKAAYDQDKAEQLILPGFKAWDSRFYNDTPERDKTLDSTPQITDSEDTKWYDIWRSIKQGD